jgi:elongation factor P
MDTSDIRKNLKIMVDGQPYVVVDFQFVKPGKGQAFTRCKLRNLLTGSSLERTWKSGEKLEPAEVETRTLNYIYPEGDEFVFMDESTGEQVHVSGDVMEDEKQWLTDGMKVEVTLLKDRPIGVEIPAHVVLQVVTSEPGIRGDTASGATKPATLSTGAVVNVPLFIEEGDWLKIDTRTGAYLERVRR